MTTVSLSHPDVNDPLDFGWIIEGGKYCPKWFDGAIALRAIEITLDDDADTGDEVICLPNFVKPISILRLFFNFPVEMFCMEKLHYMEVFIIPISKRINDYESKFLLFKYCFNSSFYVYQIMVS